MRCFVALWPSAPVRDALAHSVRLPGNCRPVPPANYHLTLCFLGDIPETRIPALSSVVADLRVTPFSFDLAVTGHFDGPGVAWVGPVIESEELRRLQRAVAGRLSDAGFAFDARPFRAHVTVARRCREPGLAWHGPPIAWPVDGVALCRSDGTDAGVRYSVIARTAPASVR